MYTKGKYLKQSDEKILKVIKKYGFNPVKFTDEANYIYESHSHKETKLLVFLDGEMDVVVNDEKFKCQKGDELIIPGNSIHSAIVGNQGCTFFWSEKKV